MSDPQPRLAFTHLDDVPWQEVLAQQHGEKRVSVSLKFLEWTEGQMVDVARYDPHVVIERHGHKSNHLVYVLEGDLAVGDRRCPAGTLIVLELGATFGPLIAGEGGALLLEVWMGDPGPVPADKEGFYALLRQRGIERLPLPTIERPANAPARRREKDEGYG